MSTPYFVGSTKVQYYNSKYSSKVLRMGKLRKLKEEEWTEEEKEKHAENLKIGDNLFLSLCLYLSFCLPYPSKPLTWKDWSRVTIQDFHV